MTDDSGRLFLAPRLGPWPSPGAETTRLSPCFYLSWPGWEDYLAKRLGLAPDPAAAPLMLPADPEDLTLAALDQLADRAGRQGADLWPLLLAPSAESPSALAAAIRHPAAPTAPRPLLSDRAYLALWTLAECQAAAGTELLAEAARKERAMWAALKGEEAAPSLPTASAPEEPDRRAAYAWRCWRRLAAPIIRPGDLILPTVPEFLDDTLKPRSV